MSDEQLFLKEKLRQQRSSIRRSGNGTGTVAFWCSLQFVTVTVSIFRIANRVRANGRFFARIPDVGVTSRRNARGIVGGARSVTEVKAT